MEDTVEEIVALFKELPFHPWEDDEYDYEPKETQPVIETVKKQEPLSIGPPTNTLTIPKLFSKGN